MLLQRKAIHLLIFFIISHLNYILIIRNVFILKIEKGIKNILRSKFLMVPFESFTEKYPTLGKVWFGLVRFGLIYESV